MVSIQVSVLGRAQSGSPKYLEPILSVEAVSTNEE